MLTRHALALVGAVTWSAVMPAAAAFLVCPEDIDGSGFVDEADLLEVYGSWGPCGMCPADCNVDGIVDRVDAALVLSKWGDAVACAPPVEGTIAHAVIPVDNSAGAAEAGFEPGSRHFTFDVMVTVTDDPNCWTTTEMEAQLTDPLLTFYQHPVEELDGMPPDPAMFGSSPALEFDTYWTGVKEIAPGQSGTFGTVLVPEPPVLQPQLLSALWFDSRDTVWHAQGLYTIARITLESDDPFNPCLAIVPAGAGGAAPVLGTITGTTTHAAGVEAPESFAFDIIEGDIAEAEVGPGSSVTLNPGGGPNNPVEEAFIQFSNISEDQAASITVCQFDEDIYPIGGGYRALDETLVMQVSLDDGLFFSRVFVPFTAAEVPAGGWGPVQVELTYYDADVGAWLLAPLGNSTNSPGFAERAGDAYAVIDQPPPTSYSDDLGDYGIYWDSMAESGFVWANLDFDGPFAAGLPQCLSDVDGNGIVDVQDVLAVIFAWGPCIQPPYGCEGDVNFDGKVDMHDVAAQLASWGSGGCLAPPVEAVAAAEIHHTVREVDNAAGEAEWGPGTAGVSHFTFDLNVVLWPTDNGWSVTSATALMTDPALSIFQHQVGTNDPPLLMACQIFPAVAFDSFLMAGTRDRPCEVELTVPVSAGLVSLPGEYTGAWTPGLPVPLTGGVAYRIGRYTFIVADPCDPCHLRPFIVQADTGGADPVLGTITGASSHLYGITDAISFSFDVIDLCAADIDDDGTVGVDDLTEVILGWNQAGLTPVDADRSGLVDVDDLLLVILAWGDCPPANDLWAGAEGPLDVDVTAPGTTRGATVDTFVSDCGPPVVAPGVWYTVMGTGTTMTASTCGDVFDYDTRLSVYCGSSLEPVCVSGNDDDCPAGADTSLSTISWCGQEGTEYWILVHGPEEDPEDPDFWVGDFQLLVSGGAPCDDPPNCP